MNYGTEINPENNKINHVLIFDTKVSDLPKATLGQHERSRSSRLDIDFPMCMKQIAGSHSSAEAETLSLDAGSRMGSHYN